MTPFGRRRSAIGLATALMMGAVAADARADQLLASWQFEQNYLDSSGNNHTLTPSGSHAFVADSPSGAPGTYSVTNPSGSYLQADFAGPANGWSLDYYFKSTMTSGIGFLATTFDHTNTDGDGTGGWDLNLNNGKVVFETLADGLPGTDASQLASAGSYADGSWHHVVAGLSTADLMTLSIDGVSQGQLQGQLPPASRNNLRFGLSYSVFGDPFAFSGSFDAIQFSTLSAVPGPASVVLIGLGAAGVAAIRRRF